MKPPEQFSSARPGGQYAFTVRGGTFGPLPDDACRVTI